ncbi:MAG TPA: hypothetical protein VIT92_01220 [Burkholderiaceae bacterium]
MSDMTALKKEREEILARMDVTRTRYRAEMLINRRLAAAGYRAADEGELRFAHDVQSDVFPRSVTMRTIMQHPYAAAGVAALLAVFGPQKLTGSVSRTVLSYAPALIANSSYAPMLARVMPYIKQFMAYREAKSHAQRARSHGSHRADIPEPVAHRDRGFERTVHHEHLQQTYH